MRLKNLSGNTYEFVIGQELEEELIDDFYHLLQETTEQHEKINLVAKIENFPSFRKFRKWGMLSKVKLSAWNKVNRYALISDEKWVENLFPLAELISFGITIKLFHEKDYQAAVAWAKAEVKPNIKAEDFLRK